jgi:hypothetical protein
MTQPGTLPFTSPQFGRAFSVGFYLVLGCQGINGGALRPSECLIRFASAHGLDATYIHNKVLDPNYSQGMFRFTRIMERIL